MFKKWIQKVVPWRAKRKQSNKKIISQHSLSIDKLSHAAEKIIKRLHQAGFEAYVVGGAVRDLLLDKEPKDFDIVTNAKPEQIRKIFRRSRIIGRRFQIVHVMVGPETIEVTTFRGGNNMPQNEHGRIMRDNQFGTMDEDALRRDFTCNALYYEPIKNLIIDYHHGYQDILNKKIVMIGNPDDRFKEDPIRILRAVRLSSKLGFSLSQGVSNAIPKHVHLIKKEPISRLFDEILKQLLSGCSLVYVQKLQQLDVPTDIHPLFQALDKKDGESAFLRLALKQTDERIAAGKTISIGFILAALLWDNVNSKWQHFQKSGMKPAQAMMFAVNEVKDSSESGWGIPQRFSATMREIWQLQPQFLFVKGKRPFRLLAQPRFRAAYDFLVLRAQSAEAPTELAQWWTEFQNANETRQNEMVAQTPKFMIEKPTRRRRRHVKKPTVEIK